MKRLIAAAVLILFIITCLVANNLLTDKILKTVNEELSNCKSAAEKGDYALAEKYAENLKNNWTKTEKYYSAFINHNLIDDVTLSVVKLIPLAKTKNDIFLTECQIIEELLLEIKDYSHLSLHNLL